MAVRLARFAQRRRLSRPARFLLAAALPCVVTFVLAGLWHGAGWTFVLFGLTWGVALSVNYAWRESDMPALPPAAGWALTMLVALASMVLFRADGVAAAWTMFAAMGGFTSATSSLVPAASLVPALAALIVALVLAPNSQQLVRDYPVTSDAVEPPSTGGWRAFAWHNNAVGVACTATAFLVAVLSINGSSHFLYYKF
jgi:hypothetical protein